MKETNAALAGEMSGHIFFADQYYGFDDGLYAAIRLLNIIAKSPKSLSEMRLELQETFATEEIRIDCKDEEKFAIIAKLVKFMKENGEKFDDIDGVRATNEKGWWLIRASNTQAALVARCEGNSPENLVEIKANLRSKLEFCGLKAPLALN
jgi:phosphomannomutase